MKKLIITTAFLILSLIFAAVLYSFDAKPPIIKSIKNDEKIIHIVPLGDIDSSYLEFARKQIVNFYGFECVIEKKIPLTDDILASSKKRYEASKIITKYNSKKNVLLLTDADIAHFNKKKNIREYGIIGLGFRPGTTCVVSTFRIKKNVSNRKLLERLGKVSIHEVGHNLGLDHCPHDRKCVMNDARGTVKQIDMEDIWLCDKCNQQIGRKVL
jgi:archaemetzincin